MTSSLNWLQWPAMAVTIVAAWLVASQSERRRAWGFWIFLVSNVLWIVWGFVATAYALVILQFFLGISNIRGTTRNRAT